MKVWNPPQTVPQLMLVGSPPFDRAHSKALTRRLSEESCELALRMTCALGAMPR
jgi:hypothetical protein